MAFQNHNSNVLPYHDARPWQSSRQKQSGKKHTGEIFVEKVPKENYPNAMSYRIAPNASTAVLSGNHQFPQETSTGAADLGSLLTATPNAIHQIDGSAFQPVNTITKIEGHSSETKKHDADFGASLIKETTKSTFSISAPCNFDSSRFYPIPSFDGGGYQQNSSQAMTSRLESLKKGQPESAMLPPPGFAKYVDVARSSTTSSTAVTKNVPAFTIYEDRIGIHGTEEPPSSITSSMHLKNYSQKLHALSSKGDRWAAQEAEAMLREMISKYKDNVHDIQPDGGCYNCVIHAYAEAGLPYQAENVMRLMFSDYKNGNVSAEPNVRCLTNVLHAWRKSKDPEAPDRCEALLSEMYAIGGSNSSLSKCKPDTFAITVLLHCWVESNRDDAITQAEEAFRQMKNRFQGGDESMRPDCVSYSILLNTYAQKMMSDDAERILWEMIDDFTLYGNKAAEPRTRNFNTIIAMYSRSSIFDAPEKAEKVLRRYRELCAQNVLFNKPDEYSYSLLLKAWCASKRDDGVNQALSRLNWMRELEEDAAFPDVVKYTTIISAFARKCDIAGAEALLHRMITDYLKNKDSRVMPDVSLFDNVIKAFTTPDNVSMSSAYRAESLMRNMWYLCTDCGVNVRPKGTTYKHVIIGFKKAGMALRADELLWEMENKAVGKPSKELIQTVMNAWHESSHPEKQKRINTLRLYMYERFPKIEGSVTAHTNGSTRRE